ncbi:MAG: hypothetical protein WCA91_18010 [Candidatus Acidiferrales bacterium]
MSKIKTMATVFVPLTRRFRINTRLKNNRKSEARHMPIEGQSILEKWK